MRKIKVGVFGLGTIGKRVADAVKLQPDMELIGVGVRSLRLPALAARLKSIPLFNTAAIAENPYSLPLAGDLEELVSRADIIVDCGSSGKSSHRREFYRERGVRCLFQGGEKHAHFGLTFSSFANYSAAYGAQQAKVASCNTTGVTRLIKTLEKESPVAQVNLALVRCAADPNKARKGFTNGALAVPGLSHHAEDLKRLMPDINFYSQAIAVPMIHGHIIMLAITLKQRITRESVLDQLKQTPRILVISGPLGYATSSQVSAFAGRMRSDRSELIIWEESVKPDNDKLHVMLQIHMEAIVVPETIDCIRSMTEREQDRESCLRQTDEALDIRNTYLTEQYFEKLRRPGYEQGKAVERII